MTGVPTATTAPLRIAILGYMHEGNSFSPVRVTKAALEATGMQRGDDVLRSHRNAQTLISGFIEAAEETDAEGVPLLYAEAFADGPVERGAFEGVLDELAAGLREHGPWDGVLAFLHGAAVAEGYLDADAEALARIRSAVGPSVPIGVGFDMHGNLGERMGALAQVMVGYRTNPHVDARARGLEVGRLVIAAARGECRPVTVVRPVPAVIGIIRQGTADAPMRELIALAEEAEARPGILSASIVEGYPWADVPEMGMSVVVVADADAELAAAEAERLAAEVWARREAFVAEGLTAAAAVARVASAEHTPLLLLDVADNIGGGAPGDSATLLLEARRRDAGPILAIVVNPGGAREAHVAGVGADIAFALRDGECDVLVAGEVAALADGRYEELVTSHGGQRYFDAGPSAAIRLPDGSVVVLATRRVIPSSLQQLAQLGIDPARFRAIVAKGVNSPLAAYGPVTSEALYVDTPGVTSADLSRFAYRHRRTPLYPFEHVVT